MDTRDRTKREPEGNGNGNGTRRAETAQGGAREEPAVHGGVAGFFERAVDRLRGRRREHDARRYYAPRNARPASTPSYDHPPPRAYGVASGYAQDPAMHRLGGADPRHGSHAFDRPGEGLWRETARFEPAMQPRDSRSAWFRDGGAWDRGAARFSGGPTHASGFDRSGIGYEPPYFDRNEPARDRGARAGWDSRDADWRGDPGSMRGPSRAVPPSGREYHEQRERDQRFEGMSRRDAGDGRGGSEPHEFWRDERDGRGRGRW
jgi:hypothetical protein